MGSIVSGMMTNNAPDPVTGLTPKEQKLITSSWALVQKDPVGNGLELFLLFFKKHPKYQDHFSFRNTPLAELRENKMLQIHVTSVMSAFNAIVDNLSNSEILLNLLIKNGMSHGDRGVEEQSYWDLKAVFLELLQQQLGSKITEETTEAWDKVLTVAFKVAVEHLKTDDDDEEEGEEEEEEEEQQPKEEQEDADAAK